MMSDVGIKICNKPLFLLLPTSHPYSLIPFRNLQYQCHNNFAVMLVSVIIKLYLYNNLNLEILRILYKIINNTYIGRNMYNILCPQKS